MGSVLFLSFQVILHFSHAGPFLLPVCWGRLGGTYRGWGLSPPLLLFSRVLVTGRGLCPRGRCEGGLEHSQGPAVSPGTLWAACPAVWGGVACMVSNHSYCTGLLYLSNLSLSLFYCNILLSNNKFQK